MRIETPVTLAGRIVFGDRHRHPSLLLDFWRTGARMLFWNTLCFALFALDGPENFLSITSHRRGNDLRVLRDLTMSAANGSCCAGLSVKLTDRAAAIPAKSSRRNSTKDDIPSGYRKPPGKRLFCSTFITGTVLIDVVRILHQCTYQRLSRNFSHLLNARPAILPRRWGITYL